MDVEASYDTQLWNLDAFIQQMDKLYRDTFFLLPYYGIIVISFWKTTNFSHLPNTRTQFSGKE